MDNKFDIGDKVKLLNSYKEFNAGEIGIVVYVGKFFKDYLVNFDLSNGYKESKNVCVNEYDLELISEEGEYEW